MGSYVQYEAFYRSIYDVKLMYVRYTSKMI